MTKFKKMFLCSLLAALIAVVLSIGFAGKAYANAETSSASQENGTYSTEGTEGTESTTGIASLSLAIDGGDGIIWTTVRCDASLFFPTVIVIIELYSSETYYESYSDMTLMCRDSIDDLNLGKSITVSASTGGVEKYWQGRMRYKVDSGSWKSEVTGTLRFDGDGNFLGYL